MCVCVCCSGLYAAAGRSQSLLQVLTSRCCKRHSFLRFIERETCLLRPLKCRSIGMWRGHGRCRAGGCSGHLTSDGTSEVLGGCGAVLCRAGMILPVCDVSTLDAFCRSSVENNEDRKTTTALWLDCFISPHRCFRSRDVFRTSSFSPCSHVPKQPFPRLTRHRFKTDPL